MEWRNQVAVVTGGSRGIGRATARLLVGKKHHIAQNRWNRCLERRGHQACDHTGGTA
jgi:NAD(P)-dependent dehydrogenase (short-subunit alcohol dehydrogenase family)